MTLQILTITLLVYILGVGIALELIALVQRIKGIRFSESHTIKLALGSWYTCIVLNSILNND